MHTLKLSCNPPAWQQHSGNGDRLVVRKSARTLARLQTWYETSLKLVRHRPLTACKTSFDVARVDPFISTTTKETPDCNWRSPGISQILRRVSSAADARQDPEKPDCLGWRMLPGYLETECSGMLAVARRSCWDCYMENLVLFRQSVEASGKVDICPGTFLAQDLGWALLRHRHFMSYSCPPLSLLTKA